MNEIFNWDEQKNCEKSEISSHITLKECCDCGPTATRSYCYKMLAVNVVENQ